MARALLCAVLVIALGCIDESAAVAGACVETEVESLLQRPASVRDQILHIVDFREKLLETSVPDDLVALKRRFVNYYTEVGSHIKRSVHTDLGQTVDCIPFLKQPALLWAGEEVKKEAVTLLAKSTGDAQDAAGEQEANQEQEPTEHYGCGPDEVPLPRPSLQALRRGLVQEFRKTGSPTGGLWPSAGRDHQGLALLQVGNDDCRTIRPPHPGPPNHTYSTSPICKTHGSRTAFAVLELAGALAEVPSSGGHTLNQLWWKGVPPKSKLPVSLETGWLTNDLTGISDARSSQRIGTRLFVYSTPNAYLPKDDCEGGNAYDHWGGFVQYPGSPALGVYTVNKLRSVFLYRTVGSTQEGMPERVEFYLAKLGKDYGKPRSVASKRHLVGYWPKSHFCQGFPKHEDLLLYTGLEVFVPSQCPGMPRTASGRILGWGTDWNAGDPEFYPMLKDDGSEAVFLATAKQEWQASVGYDPKWLAPYVDFSGTYRPVSCVVPGKLPCEDITCPRR